MQIVEKIHQVLKKQYIPTTDFYSQIIDSLQDYCLFTVDNQLNINSWNSGAANIFHYETEEIIGKPFEIIFTEEDKKAGIPETEISVAQEKGRSVDIRWHVGKNGDTFYADGLVFPLKNDTGEVIGFVKILRDITLRKKAEDEIKRYSQELEDLNAHKETVLAVLSHDLRSPLAGIIQATDYLKSNIDTVKPAFAKELVDELHNSIHNHLRMLDYLVEWARIKYVADAFTPVKIELTDTVDKVFESFKETAARQGIELKAKFQKDTKVFADEKMVFSIVQNLVSNAIKHSHRGGQVIVSAEKRKDKMVVLVKDTGVGISEEIQENLFAPQLKSLSVPREFDKGAGIGLLMVKGFLEKNGDEIWVESKEGQGTSFYFTLPFKKTKNKMQNVEKLEKEESL